MRRHSALIAEYARLAPVYDRRWARYVDATVAQTLRHLPNRQYARVLDVGCGTGTFLASLGARLPSAQLVGIDLSRHMLDVARAKVPAFVALSQARAERLPFDSERFDLLVSLSAFHYFSGDLQDVTGELYRVLRPGGVLLLTDWCRDFLSCRSFAFFAHLRRGADFTVLGAERCRLLLERAGFSEVGVERYRIDWFWGLMTARAEKPG